MRRRRLSRQHGIERECTGGYWRGARASWGDSFLGIAENDWIVWDKGVVIAGE
ncbi:MAG TPA: hypothetical protein VM163_00530 [bacterium]|nr:hypothetical protein [bacterium]